MFNGNMEMVVTDLDGTLLDDKQQVSARDLETMNLLGDRGICRVIATGRSFYSLRRVLPPEFPIDYLVFSSGIGIMEWKTKRMIKEHHLDAGDVHQTAEILVQRQLDFMIHYPVPKNHRFGYVHSGKNNPDFYHRIELYKDFSHDLMGRYHEFGNASQLLSITPAGESLYHEIRLATPELNVIRTTSPLDHRSLWIEFFPPGASKSLGSQEVCRQTGCDAKNVLAVGNDYNDLDLLHWAACSAVVQNAPEDLKQNFKTVSSHCESGFSDAVAPFL